MLNSIEMNTPPAMHIDRSNAPGRSESDLALLATALQAVSRVRGDQAFTAWIEHELQQIFPHGGVLCGLGRVSGQKWTLHRMFVHRFPVAYVQNFVSPQTGEFDCPFLNQWSKSREPLLCELGAADRATVAEVPRIRHFGIRSVAIHGGIDDVFGTGHFMMLTNHVAEPNSRQLLEFLLPSAAAAFLRIAAELPQSPPRTASKLQGWQLTQNEIEIAGWLGQGKSNADIAKILGKSNNTIKHQVTSLLRKLGVSNRVQAAVKLHAIASAEPAVPPGEGQS
jgi:DNA-binding CsgD family transcriptional regulator